MYVNDIRLTDISTRSEYVLDIWVLRNNKKMLINRVNQILAVARRINKQDDYIKYMLSVIAIVMWLFSKMSTYPELGQIRNWPKNCSPGLMFFGHFLSRSLIANLTRGIAIWRVERVIILFCYFNCNSSIYILVFNKFVTFTILILSL